MKIKKKKKKRKQKIFGHLRGSNLGFKRYKTYIIIHTAKEYISMNLPTVLPRRLANHPILPQVFSNKYSIHILEWGTAGTTIGVIELNVL